MENLPLTVSLCDKGGKGCAQRNSPDSVQPARSTERTRVVTHRDDPETTRIEGNDRT